MKSSDYKIIIMVFFNVRTIRYTRLRVQIDENGLRRPIYDIVVQPILSVSSLNGSGRVSRRYIWLKGVIWTS